MKTLQKNAGIIVTVVIFLFAIYIYKVFFEQSVEIGVTESSARNVGTNLVNTYGRLQGVVLDESLLSTAGYRQLVDFDADIPELPRGRSNPFNPIGR